MQYKQFSIEERKFIQQSLWNPYSVRAIARTNVRAAIKALIGTVYIDFSAIVAVGGGGHRIIPCAGRNGGRWHGGWCCLDNGFVRYGRLAVSGK